jgi:hypothetical protein
VQLALNYKDPDVPITVEGRNGDLLFIVELIKGEAISLTSAPCSSIYRTAPSYPV